MGIFIHYLKADCLLPISQKFPMNIASTSRAYHEIASSSKGIINSSISDYSLDQNGKAARSSGVNVYYYHYSFIYT